MSKKKNKRRSLGQQKVARVDFKNLYRMEVDDLIGVCSDPHLGSKYDSLDELDLYYDILDDRGIRQVFNGGDLSDGTDVYRGQHYQQKVWGFQDHTDYIVKNYPKKSQIKTYHIGGNHDASFIIKIDANVGKAIHSRRLDMPYLGEYYARIKDYKFNFDLVHLRRGRSYAVCFDDQTEILTETGWKLFKDLLLEDKVATLNQEHSLEFQAFDDYFEYDYKGDMIHFLSRTVDLMVTPNHKLFVRRYPHKISRLKELIMPQKSHKRVNTKWQLLSAEYILKNYARQKWQMTQTCNWKGKKIRFYTIPSYSEKTIPIGTIEMDLWLEVLGWYVSEGSISKDKTVYISQQIPENRKEIEDLLIKAGIPYGKDDVSFRIYRKDLAVDIQKLCGKGSENKKIPKFVKTLSKRQINIFFESYMKGDGWKDRNGWTGAKTKSKQLVDDLQEMGVKLGYSSTTSYRKSEDIYEISFARIQNQPTINNKPEIVKYEGKVYCVNVPNHVILTRRNGRIIWSGNSYPAQTFLRESLNPNYIQYPQLVALGHRHQNWIGQLQSVWCCEAGHFQKPTPYTIEKGIISPRGGWILEMDREGPNIYRMKAEWIQTDKKKPGSKYRK